MPQTRPGEAVPANPSSEWFKFWHGYLLADEDPRFRVTWDRALKVGQRMAIERTSNWAGLVPLLQDVLDHLIELAIERDMDAGVDLTSVNDCEAGEHVVPGVEAVTSRAPQPVEQPDSTVEDTSVQVGS